MRWVVPGARVMTSSAAFAVSTQTMARWPAGPKSPIFSAFSDHGFHTTVDRLPVLVMGGECDPITPVAFSEEIAASLPPERVRFARFADCGHAIMPDAPDEALRTIRDFIAG